MRPRQLRWKRLLFVLVLLALLAISLVPWWIGDTSEFGMRVAARLTHWTGANVQLTGPIQIRYFPDISIRSGFKMTGSGKLPMIRSISADDAKISLNLGKLLLGHVRVEGVKLIRPQIDLTQPKGIDDGDAGKATLAFLKLMREGPLDLLQLSHGTITLMGPKGPETVHHVKLEINGGIHADDVSSTGSFEWRNVPVHFSLDAGVNAQALKDPKSDAKMPLTLSINSEPITANIEGQAQLRPALEVDGDMQATIVDLRHLLSWVGIAHLNGPGLQNISATGPFHLGGGALTFDQGRYSVDGNHATGLLAISLGGARPRVEATLAFDALNLDPYRTKPAPSAVTPPNGQVLQTAAKSSQGKPLFDWPLLQQIDADLRLSATSVTIDNHELGGGAFTLSANHGVLNGEIGEVALCGGSASGQFSVDLTKRDRQADVSGSLEGVDLAPCLKLLDIPLPLTGVSTIKGSLSTQGRDWNALLQDLTGDFEMKAKNGTVPVDLASAMAATASYQAEGWNADNGTGFDSLDTTCHVSDGHVACQKFSMENGKSQVSGTGDVDIIDRNLDWDMEMTNPSLAQAAADIKTKDVKTQQPERIAIKGPWSKPLISRLPPQRPIGENVYGATPDVPVTPN